MSLQIVKFVLTVIALIYMQITRLKRCQDNNTSPDGFPLNNESRATERLIGCARPKTFPGKLQYMVLGKFNIARVEVVITIISIYYAQMYYRHLGYLATLISVHFNCKFKWLKLPPDMLGKQIRNCRSFSGAAVKTVFFFFAHLKSTY